jgi:hypothetical protein
MLQLFFEKTDLSDSVAPVRWCIDADMAREIKVLRAMCNQTFAVLFDVLNEQSGRESRFVASLEDMMTFISFSGPGKNFVRAIVVYSCHDIQKIKSEFLCKRTNRSRYLNFPDGTMFYGRSMASADSIIRRLSYFYCDLLPESDITDVEIVVPKELFAKKPPEWLWNFVNYYFEEESFEQCDFRRKALYAIPFGLIAMPLQAVFLVFCRAFLALVCILFGFRGVNYRAIIHPFSASNDDILDGILEGDSYFWSRRKKGKNSDFASYDVGLVRHPAFWPLTPIFPVSSIIIFWLISLKVKLLLWPMFLILGLGIPVAISALILAFHGLALLVMGGLSLITPTPKSSLYSKLTTKWKRIRQTWKRERKEKNKKLTEQREQKRTKQLEENLKRVTCIGTPLVPRLEALPKEAQTIRLRFLDLKAKVCRPYAR